MPARKYISDLRSRWQYVYNRALRDYGSTEQAERIAWGAIDYGLTHKPRQGQFEGSSGRQGRSGFEKRQSGGKIKKAA